MDEQIEIKNKEVTKTSETVCSLLSSFNDYSSSHCSAQFHISLTLLTRQSFKPNDVHVVLTPYLSSISVTCRTAFSCSFCYHPILRCGYFQSVSATPTIQFYFSCSTPHKSPFNSFAKLSPSFILPPQDSHLSYLAFKHTNRQQFCHFRSTSFAHKPTSKRRPCWPRRRRSTARSAPTRNSRRRRRR